MNSVVSATSTTCTIHAAPVAPQLLQFLVTPIFAGLKANILTDHSSTASQAVNNDHIIHNTSNGSGLPLPVTQSSRRARKVKYAKGIGVAPPAHGAVASDHIPNKTLQLNQALIFP